MNDFLGFYDDRDQSVDFHIPSENNVVGFAVGTVSPVPMPKSRHRAISSL
jgi:hypothetical protein